MECPFCQYKKTEVYNSRQSKEQQQVWRRRRCKRCLKAFTTYESTDLKFISVIKSGGEAEPFSRIKLMLSLYQACGHNEALIETIEPLTGTIESRILARKKTVVTGEDIVDCAATVLKRYDPAMFMRYLSYREGLSSLNQLKQELQRL